MVEGVAQQDADDEHAHDGGGNSVEGRRVEDHQRDHRGQDQRQVLRGAHDGQALRHPCGDHHAGDERQGRWQHHGDPGALEHAREHEGGKAAIDVHAGQQQDARRGEVQEAPDGEQPRGPERVDQAPADEGGRDLDGRCRPHHEPDRCIRDPRSGERQRQGGGIGLEAHLHEEHRDGQPEDGHQSSWTTGPVGRAGRFAPGRGPPARDAHPTGEIRPFVPASRGVRRQPADRSAA
jgi:hypothetical protein